MLNFNVCLYFKVAINKTVFPKKAALWSILESNVEVVCIKHNNGNGQSCSLMMQTYICICSCETHIPVLQVSQLQGRSWGCLCVSAQPIASHPALDGLASLVCRSFLLYPSTLYTWLTEAYWDRCLLLPLCRLPVVWQETMWWTTEPWVLCSPLRPDVCVIARKEIS